MYSKRETSTNKDKMKQKKRFVKRKHVCTICQKGFTHKRYLNSHLLSHSGEKPYQCTICNRQFRQKSHLNTHMLVHSGEKPYQCPTCSKQLRRKYDLNAHMLIHLGVKPYECPTCHKRFTNNGSLHNHLKTHSGGKEHVCSICQRTFTRKGNLDGHVKNVHLNQRPYICDVCKKGFARKQKLIIHLSMPRDEELIDNETFKCRGDPRRRVKKKKVTSQSKQISPIVKKSSLVIKSSSSRRYSDEIVKTEIDADLELSDLCFEVPIIKQELMSEGYAETPSCSYQTLNVKQEPTENADPACLNLCDDNLIKEETDYLQQLESNVAIECSGIACFFT